MTLKIEKKFDGTTAVVYLTGRITVDHLDELKAQMKAGIEATAIDLDQVNLVDVEAVRFLGACEAGGIAIFNDSPFIREWIRRERAGVASRTGT